MAAALTSAIALRDAIARRTISAEEACRQSLSRLESTHASLNAFLHVNPERALARARALDASREPPGPLHGVPIAIKDNIVVTGMPATAGSRVLEGYVPPYDATVVERLEAAGAVIVGKTNCDEFAMGSSTEHSAFGPTRNPSAPDRTPGGSSGGSAAAVAAGVTPLAIGSDTGGSVRQPAGCCGVVGVKPTYGRISRYGLIAFASSLDQIGPLSVSVADAALTLEVLCGADARDATSAARPAEAFSTTLDGSAKGLRIGVPRHLLDEGVEPAVAAAFEASLKVLAAQGATVRTVQLPHSRYAIPVYYLVATAEASSNLARYDGVRYGRRATGATGVRHMYERTRNEGFGAEVKRRIMLGTYVLSEGYYDAYYLKAQQIRTLIRRDYDDAFADVDLIATPTSPTPAFKLGERQADPIQMYLADVFTVSAPLAGLPAMSVPCAVKSGDLPIGLHLTARAWDERTMLRAADAYERSVL